MAKMNLKTQAYNTIRQKIITCEYEPGTFLNEEFLTNQLGLSRTPVRDALGRLEQEGLVEIKPKKGFLVTPLSINMINMIYEIRLLYEPYIIQNYGSSLSTEKLKEFYNIFHQKKSDSTSSQTNDYFYELDAKFHNFIVHACPNTYIHRNYDMIVTQNERFRYMTGNISNHRIDDTCQEHLEIIRSCIQSDWNVAAQKMIYHLEESK
ncbi:MAG: GntR family transcriptional regulator, partial [Dorea sp.]|nr:GntR family transcriptional regulator [Dorea sp.]